MTMMSYFPKNTISIDSTKIKVILANIATSTSNISTFKVLITRLLPNILPVVVEMIKKCGKTYYEAEVGGKDLLFL